MEQELENNHSNNSNSELQIVISNESAENENVESSDNSLEIFTNNQVVNEREGHYFENYNLPLLGNRTDNRRSPFRLNRNIRNYSRLFNPFILRYENPIETENFSELNYFNYNPDVDDFDDCNSILRSSKELYGSLSIHTIKKLLSFKLINFTLITDRIYKKVLDVYLNNLNSEKSDSKSMFKQTRLFMSCLPSIRYIEKFANKVNFNSKKQEKNIFFLKLCLDIYEDYYKTFDFPLFKKYSTNFLNTALKFYKKLSEENLKVINDQINNYFKNISMNMI